MNYLKSKMDLVICALVAVNLLAAPFARADVTCRDYYVSYLNSATMPNPPIIVIEVPHYHGHYPEYGSHGGHGHSDEADMLAMMMTTGLLLTTTTAEDARLDETRQMINIIDQADMGDGPQLRDFTNKVQSLASVSVGLRQVAQAVYLANLHREFCRGGDLDSVDELASRIANKLSLYP